MEETFKIRINNLTTPVTLTEELKCKLNTIIQKLSNLTKKEKIRWKPYELLSANDYHGAFKTFYKKFDVRLQRYKNGGNEDTTSLMIVDLTSVNYLFVHEETCREIILFDFDDSKKLYEYIYKGKKYVYDKSYDRDLFLAELTEIFDL